MLEPREWYALCNESGGMILVPDPYQNADGSFPNRELAEAAATANWEAVKDTIYVVSMMRTPVATVSGTTQVVVKPV